MRREPPSLDTDISYLSRMRRNALHLLMPYHMRLTALIILKSNAVIAPGFHLGSVEKCRDMKDRVVQKLNHTEPSLMQIEECQELFKLMFRVASCAVKSLKFCGGEIVDYEGLVDAFGASPVDQNGS